MMDIDMKFDLPDEEGLEHNLRYKKERPYDAEVD